MIVVSVNITGSGDSQIEGQPYTLTCEVSRNVVTSFFWLKNGKPLPQRRNSILQFSNLTMTDSGAYICMATIESRNFSSTQFTILVRGEKK